MNILAERFAKAQVDIKKLDGFAESFDDYGVAFQRAILYQVAGDVNILLGTSFVKACYIVN